MMKNNPQNIIFAALDIGTSQIKLGVYSPMISPCLTILDRIENKVDYGAGGKAKASWDHTLTVIYQLFNKLGEYIRENQPDKLFLGLCSHVSSLLEWDPVAGAPLCDEFPIWMDATCEPALDKFESLMGEEKSEKVLGSFLPPGTNWLLTKLLFHTRNKNVLYLQAGDAVFNKLSDFFVTHYSSQISLVHHVRKEYVNTLLANLNIQKNQLPEIREDYFAVSPKMKKNFGWPVESYVFPALADFYASFHGLELEDNEGFILGNTSEVMGFYTKRRLPVSRYYIDFPYDSGMIRYGSTNSGANLISWFVKNILDGKVTEKYLAGLTAAAEALRIEDTPIFLPYIMGERAPLWDQSLKASFINLQSHHTEVHLFRAILEAVAFARRQGFEFLDSGNIKIIRMGGGSSANALWNSIRANVLNTNLAVADQKELAVSGLINNMCAKLSIQKLPVSYKVVKPDQKMVLIYEKKYLKFLNYQKILN